MPASRTHTVEVVSPVLHCQRTPPEGAVSKVLSPVQMGEVKVMLPLSPLGRMVMLRKVSAVQP